MLKTIQNNLGIILIILLAFFIRLPLLDGSVWLDEAAQLLESERPFNQQLDIVDDFQPPFLHYLLHGALQLNTQVPWLRFIGALLPGLITIFYTYQIGKTLYSQKTGLLASILLAISSFHVFYSQELRPYSWPTAFALLSWYQIVKVTQTDDKKRPLIPFIIFSLTTTLGLYSSYLYPFLFLSQLVYLLYHSKRWLPHAAITTALSIVAFLPLVPTFIAQLSAGGLVREQLVGWADVVSVPQLKSIPLTFGKFVYGVLTIDSNAFFIVTALLLLILTGTLFFLIYKKNIKLFIQENTLILIWLLIPLLTAWIISFLIPVVQPKRVLFLLPAFLLLFSSLLTQTLVIKNKISSFDSPKPITALLLLILYVFVSGYSLTSYWTQPLLQRENWRSLHSDIQKQFPQEETVLLFSFPEPFASWEYYDRNVYPTFSTGTLNIENAPNITERLKTLDRYRYLIVFDYLRDLTDPNDRLPQELEAFGYKEAQVLDYPGIGFVRVYTKPETLLSLTF